jgi:hypothetical protein
LIDLERKAYIFKQIGYKPHSPAQQAIHDSQERYRTLACGRRYGKTVFGAQEMTAAICDPEQEGYYWIVGPNYVQGEKEFRIVDKNIMTKLPFGGRVKRQYNVPQGLMRLEMPWGTVLEVKSADRKEGLLGEGLKGVLMSEAARHDSMTWEQYIRPALSDHKGWAIFTSTPKGYNWFKGLYDLGISGEPGYASWSLPSWDNPIVYPGGRDDPEILAMQAEMSPQYFAQEIGAQFTAFAGKIYEEFLDTVHVTDLQFHPNWQNFWAFDYGWSNPFVCLDIQVDPDDNVYVWRDYQKRHVSSWDHGHYLQSRSNPDGFHVDGMFGDPRGGDSRYTLELVLGSISSDEPQPEDGNSTWMIGIEYVKRWLKLQANGKPKLLIDRSCVDLIRQMDQLHAPDEKEGINVREGQHKYDDHGPDALRYFMAQYFGLGYGSSLSDIYPAGQQRTEAAGFFRQNSTLMRDGRF